MSNVVRLVSGGTIHVRTGVIQGIGPVGPRGVAGPQGIDGDQGPVGEQGPMGQILELGSKFSIGSSYPVPANTDTVIGFESIGYDGLSARDSSSNYVLTAAGDYLLSCWLRFDDAAASAREVWFKTGSTIIARTTVMAGTGAPTYVPLSFPYRSAGGDVVNVIVRAGAATAVGMGDLGLTRVGSGPPGPAGPPGPEGPIGIQGAKGDKGDDGDASSGFTTYAELLPH